MRNISNGVWFDITTQKEFDNLIAFGNPKPSIIQTQRNDRARCQKGKYIGPGKYFLLDYYQPCPRGCCEDSVYEALNEQQAKSEIRDIIKDLASLLKG